MSAIDTVGNVAVDDDIIFFVIVNLVGFPPEVSIGTYNTSCHFAVADIDHADAVYDVEPVGSDDAAPIEVACACIADDSPRGTAGYDVTEGIATDAAAGKRRRSGIVFL